MDEKEINQLEKLLLTIPGGIAKVAFDEVLTIVYATDAFYTLIKNTTEKTIAKGPMALLKMVYSADIIYVTHQLAAQKNRTDNQISFNFRSLQQDGSFKWVMINGTRTNEGYQTNAKTVSVYSCVAADVTSQMLKFKQLEQKFEYQRTIIELSKELHFEYEIATDTLSFSELFREVFGKDSEMPGFRKKLEKTKIIHQEELPAVIKIFNSVMSGRKQVRFELRLIPKDGKPVWYICYASVIFDENKNPNKVVGKLATTNPMRREEEAEAIPYKPQLDSLTKVCTKDSAEIMITESMKQQEAKDLSVLMLIDVRNYKGINDIMETVSGENVLMNIAKLIKPRIRSTDIIGRKNLNEFIVYIKDIQSDKIAYDIAEQICKEVKNLYPYEHTKNGLTVSIGISFMKGQQEYAALLANANAALVMAKKSSVNSFEVFYG